MDLSKDDDYNYIYKDYLKDNILGYPILNLSNNKIIGINIKKDKKTDIIERSTSSFFGWILVFCFVYFSLFFNRIYYSNNKIFLGIFSIEIPITNNTIS